MTKLNKAKLNSLIVAIATTLTGAAAVLAPVVPVEWKAVVAVVLGLINYLALSPVAKVLVGDDDEK